MYGSQIVPCNPNSTLLAVYEANQSVRAPLTTIVMQPRASANGRYIVVSVQISLSIITNRFNISVFSPPLEGVVLLHQMSAA